MVGSVSGGCIEDDLIRAYHDPEGADKRLHGDGRPQLLTYGISADEAHRFGLPCGGTIRLLVEFNPCPQALSDVLGLLEQRRLVQRHVDLQTGRAWSSATRVPAALHLSQDCLSVTFGPSYRLLLIGGGQLSEYVATIALFNGFDVTVCDPRSEHIQGWSVAGGPGLVSRQTFLNIEDETLAMATANLVMSGSTVTSAPDEASERRISRLAP